MFPQYDKAIYIDSDVIVNGDISEFYNNELGDNLVGACNEQAMLQVDLFGTYVEKNLGLDRKQYFNAGNLLITPAKQQIRKRAFKTAAKLCKIAVSKYTSKLGVVGAAMLVKN